MGALEDLKTALGAFFGPIRTAAAAATDLGDLLGTKLVLSIGKDGGASWGAVDLAEGAGITITRVAQKLKIAAAAPAASRATYWEWFPSHTVFFSSVWVGNRISTATITVPLPMTLTHFRVRYLANVGPNHYCVGLYDIAGGLVIKTAVMDLPASAMGGTVASWAISGGGSFSLPAGTYIIAFTTNSANASLYGGSSKPNLQMDPSYGYVATPAVDGDLPVAIAPAAVSYDWYVPWAALIGS